MSNLTKKLAMITATLVTASLFWVVAKPWVLSPLRLSDMHIWLEPLVLLIVLIATEGLALLLLTDGNPAKSYDSKTVLLDRRASWRLATVLTVGLPYLVVFGVSSRWYILGLILMMFCSWLAIRNLISESSQRFKINIYHIMQHGLPWLITGLLIMLSFAYYLSPETQAVAHNQQLPPVVQKIVEKTVETFAGNQVEGLSSQQKQSLLKQATNEVMRQFTDAVRPYFRYLPPILAFGLFLILQGLSFIFVWLGVWLAVLIFKILRMFGLVRIVEKEVKAEAIELV